MSDTITITGLVVNDPRHIVTSEGLAVTNFRLASQQRRFDRSQERWIDGETNWYTVVAFRRLATNASVSVKRGERVLVTGKLRIREWENSDRAGITAEIEAEAIGHDIGWGTSAFVRTVGSSAPKETFPSQSSADGTGSLDPQPSVADPSEFDAESSEPAPREERQPVASDAGVPF